MSFWKIKPTQTCPRRFEYAPVAEWPREAPPADAWKTGHGLVGQDKIGTSCTYCGSLHPDILMARLKDGWHLEGSDKPYKWYLARPWSAQQLNEMRQRWDTGPIGTAIAADGRDQGKSLAEIADDLDEAYGHSYGALAGRGDAVAKFYTHHLKRAQCQEFLELWRTGFLNHSMYVKPAFPAMNDAAPEWVVA